ncbi:hypothetical protein BU26DRAFT_512725 [Trematosphaeria pertusa]|uniref:Uncharacterized protein n=1 Tax=Trematosphaeria pertusa TaxID=390896 RepID=A0A6A6J1J4_9PLEO|nr:uncharacterized protein BU26DRAFT_512725 [Trematosphaeria pertusa]KAF2255760.1 hypothetical protein BU26DRAFT_512725 [Trematosphaeria pertusa]
MSLAAFTFLSSVQIRYLTLSWSRYPAFCTPPCRSTLYVSIDGNTEDLTVDLEWARHGLAEEYVWLAVCGYAEKREVIDIV